MARAFFLILWYLGATLMLIFLRPNPAGRPYRSADALTRVESWSPPVHKITPRHAAIAFSTYSVAVLASMATAQGETIAPEFAWRVELPGVSAVNRPAIGPAGEIAMQSTQIVVVEPDGSERWRRTVPVFSPNSICDFDDQGRLFANSVGGVRAFAPDGSDLWTLPAPGGAHQAHAGPTVGPDGNVYFCDIFNGGFGFASVTPGGQLRWNTPGFGDIDSDRPRVEVAFSGGSALISAPVLPDNCGGNCLGSGLMSFTFEGQEEWTRQTTTPIQPTVRPDGAIFLPLLPADVDLVDPADGSGTSIDFGSRSPVSRAVAVAPDGTGYTVANYSRLMEIDHDGTVTELAFLGAVMGTPAVSPDGSMVVVGTAESLLPSPNAVTAIDTQTGGVLWSIPLPQENGWQLTATGWPRFSDDGSSVYVGVNAGDRSYLYAVTIEGGSGCPADLTGDGVLDLADVQAFIGGFLNQEPAADLAAPFGVWDLADVQGFITSFMAGCP